LSSWLLATDSEHLFSIYRGRRTAFSGVVVYYFAAGFGGFGASTWLFIWVCLYRPSLLYFYFFGLSRVGVYTVLLHFNG